MTNIHTISSLWKQLFEMDPDILQKNISSLGYLYGCDIVLDLPPLPKIPSTGTPKYESSVLTLSPAFKNLDISGIRYLRNQIEKGTNLKELRGWAETLLRFLEIFQSNLRSKVRMKFGPHQTGKIAILELTAFMMDCHFAWKDLRFLNTAMKLMGFRWIYSIKNKGLLKSGNVGSLEINLLQLRLMIMREAALQILSGNIEHV